MKGSGRVESEAASPHDRGVVGLPLCFDLRCRTLHSSGFGRCRRTRSSTTMASSLMAAFTHSSSAPPPMPMPVCCCVHFCNCNCKCMKREAGMMVCCQTSFYTYINNNKWERYVMRCARVSCKWNYLFFFPFSFSFQLFIIISILLISLD